MIKTNKITIEFTGYHSKHSNQETGVYIIHHVLSGKKYYGTTCDVHSRLNECCLDLSKGVHSNSLLQSCANEDGTFEIIFHPTSTVDEAIQLEKDLISKEQNDLLLNLNASNPIASKRLSEARRGNINGLGYRYTDEQKDNHSNRLLGNQYRKGIKHTEETKRNMSLSRKGSKH